MKIIVSEKQLKYVASVSHELDEQDAVDPNAPESTTTAGEHKWESGVTRGPANQIDDKVKWSEIVGMSVTRGKANPLRENE